MSRKLPELKLTNRNKVSPFAKQSVQGKQQDDEQLLNSKGSLEMQENLKYSTSNGLLNSHVSNDSAADRQRSAEILDAVREEEMKLTKKGVSLDKKVDKIAKIVKAERRGSVDSRISDGAESDAGSDSSIDDDDDNGSGGQNGSIAAETNAEMDAVIEDGKTVATKLTPEQLKQKKKHDKLLKKKRKAQQAKEKLEAAHKLKQKYETDDFRIPNYVGRNVLHRSCIKQNAQMIEDLIKQFKLIKYDEEKLAYEQAIQQQQQLQLEEYEAAAAAGGGGINTALNNMMGLSGVLNNPLPPVSEESINRAVEVALKEYVNEIDRFGNSPLILSCVEESLKDQKVQNRKACLKALLDAGAEINHRNPRTLWSALHWCCHYGDLESIELLLQYTAPQMYLSDNNNNNNNNNAISNAPDPQMDIKMSFSAQQTKVYCCFPDLEGYFPIDLAGMKGHNRVLIRLIDYLVIEIKVIESKANEGPDEDEMPFYTKENDTAFMRQFKKKYLISALHKARILYWAAAFPYQNSLRHIKDIFEFEQTYVMAIQSHMNNMTSLHAAAQTKDIDVLEFLAMNSLFRDNPEKLSWMEEKYKSRVSHIFVFSITDNSVLSFIIGEEQLYKPSFLKIIQEFAVWENEFILSFRRATKQTNKNIYIDQQDIFGNTPLHLASINGFAKGVQVLLDCGADMEVDNKEGWRPRELVQHQNVRQLYSEALDKNEGMSRQLKKMGIQLEQTLRKYNEIDTTVEFDLKKREKELYSLGTRLFLPDFVIVFYITPDKLGESNQNRMNFQIDVLRKNFFNVYLLESVVKNKFYLLIGMPEDVLQLACKQNKISIKLVDSYDYEPYNEKAVTKFEPFRSKQRQEIIEMQLNKTINLKDLKSQDLIHSYYKMHTYGGISRIKFQWVDDTYWYWPQPLNQVDDYLLEEKNQNFTSVTTLRQYFGEKIAFFFGWKSFITCFMILIAVPGLALQIFIIQENTSDYNNILISFWVFYVMIWSTVIVEFWKRKTSEINYRWGTLELMNNSDILDKQLREDFIGDECISSVTGGLTKYQKKSMTIVKFLVSMPVLFGLMFLVVYIFLRVDEFKKQFTSDVESSFMNTMYKSLAGVLQGVGIQVLNIVYTWIARKFAQYENHKYDVQYERSIIYKLMAFKVLNSYFALFYVSYFQDDSNFSTLFFMLLPIMLVKQVGYTVMNVWWPLFLYKRAERNYFAQVKSTIIEHKLSQGEIDPTQGNYFDIIEKFWNDYSKEDMQNLSRPVISLAQENDDKTAASNQQGNLGDSHVQADNARMPPSVKLVRNIDVDSIELNSLRGEFLDTVNFYSDGFIDLGYITLFAAAFPIGPFICLLMNALEIRSKLNAFLSVLKRPTCERSAGIGEWLIIWQGFSFVSVVSNITLLYFKDEMLIKLFIKEEEYTYEEIRTAKLWLYVGLGIIIIFLKYVFQALIDDKPEWIQKEEEKLAYQEHIQKEANEKLMQKAQKTTTEWEEKRLKDLKLVEKKFIADIAKQEQEILELKDERDHYQSHCPDEFKNYQSQLTLSKKKDAKQLGGGTTLAKTEFQMKLFGVLRSTYIKIERELLINRMRQLEDMRIGTVVICSECSKRISEMECRECDQTFCQPCFDDFHTFTKTMNHPVVLLNRKPAIADSNYDNYFIFKEDANKRTADTSKEGSDDVGESTGLIQNHVTKWRKFEYFVLPTYKKSPLFFKLSEIFQFMRAEYLDSNGITPTSTDIDLKRFFRLKENSEQQGKFILEETKSLSRILSIPEFNVEDKLFLNRIAFLVFKRKGANVTFDHFYQICKTLQEGYPEQKFMLLLDFIDEDDSQLIDKNEVKKIFYSSFLQTSQQKHEIGQVLDDLFDGDQEMTKVEIGKKFIYSNERNPALNAFLVALLQDRKS